MKDIMRGIILGFVLAAGNALARGPVLLITPPEFQCSVQPMDLPEAIEKGQTPFQVHIAGARGKFDWRLPLYRSNNGYNDIATSQIGHAKADKKGNFVIAVTTYELGKVGNVNDLVLQVNSERGNTARCLLAPSPDTLAARGKASLTAVRAEGR